MAGFAGAVYDPAWFVAQQIPQDKPLVASENSIVMAHQLGNMYLGMCLVGLALFWTTSEARVVRNYLIALLIADAGHVGFTWYGLGSDRFMDVSRWNAMAWGNLGATVRTFPLSLTLMILSFLPLSSALYPPVCLSFLWSPSAAASTACPHLIHHFQAFEMKPGRFQLPLEEQRCCIYCICWHCS